MTKRCTRCECYRCKGRRLRRWIYRIGTVLLLVLFTQFTFSALETVFKRQDRLEREYKRNQLELEAKVSAVQAAVVETKVALSVKQTAETVRAPKTNVPKPVGKPETTYVDPLSTFVVGGVLTVGKSIITNGGRLIGAN